MPRNYKTDLFQKRHYEWLAKFVREHGYLKLVDEGRQVLELDEYLADALVGTNPRFDRERFLEACKPQED